MCLPVNSLFSSGCYMPFGSSFWTAGNQNAMVVPVPISTCTSHWEVVSVVISIVFDRSLITMLPIEHLELAMSQTNTSLERSWSQVSFPESSLHCGSHAFHIPHCWHFWAELPDLKVTLGGSLEKFCQHPVTLFIWEGDPNNASQLVWTRAISYVMSLLLTVPSIQPAITLVDTGCTRCPVDGWDLKN